MATQLDEQRTPDDRSEKAMDESMKDTFPASDPPAVGGATRIESGSNNSRDGRPDETQPDEGQPGKAQPETEKPGPDESEEEEDADEDGAGVEAPPNETSPGTKGSQRDD